VGKITPPYMASSPLLRSTYQERHGLAYDDYRIGIVEEIRTDPKRFFKYVDHKKKHVGYPSVMKFEGQMWVVICLRGL
jgi:hypothetical protein